MTGYFPQTIYQIRRHAADFDIPYKLALWMRKRFLVKWVKVSEILAPHVNLALEHYFLTDIAKAQSELKSISNALDSEDKPKDGITDDMIWTARHFPIELLIEFTRGKALAFCHADTNPSLSLHSKNNNCRCFVCNKSFGPIDILMERDKTTFVEAVKRLQRRGAYDETCVE